MYDPDLFADTHPPLTDAERKVYRVIGKPSRTKLDGYGVSVIVCVLILIGLAVAGIGGWL